MDNKSFYRRAAKKLSQYADPFAWRLSIEQDSHAHSLIDKIADELRMKGYGNIEEVDTGFFGNELDNYDAVLWKMHFVFETDIDSEQLYCEDISGDYLLTMRVQDNGKVDFKNAETKIRQTLEGRIFMYNSRVSSVDVQKYGGSYFLTLGFRQDYKRRAYHVLETISGLEAQSEIDKNTVH
jgi:hypothetical protein